jgi:capsular exopolysaccharide synthesis family protein
MSKNFELLQQAEQAREAEIALFTPEEEPRIAPPISIPFGAPPSVPAPAEPRNALLQTDDVSREEIKKLVQRLFLLPGGVRRVVFAGVDTGTGCSWMTARVADILATQVSGSVCVVDADFRAGSLHKAFSVENHFGFTDALSQPGPVKQFATRLAPNLWLMSCGSMTSNGQALLSSERLSARFAELRNEFEYILIDTPALTVCADPVAVAHFADGIALVLEADVTRRETARKTAQDLEAANIRVLGTVLNKRSFPIPQSLYDRL